MINLDIKTKMDPIYIKTKIEKNKDLKKRKKNHLPQKL
jgi:hypothetical protein